MTLRLAAERLAADRRGVSVTVGYILMFTVAMLLMGVLLAGAGGLMESQSQQVITDELTVIGNQLASNIQEADRLAVVGAADADATETGDEPTVELTVRLPERVAGTGYLVEVEHGTITLSTTNPDVEVTVPYPDPDTELAESDRLAGGDLRITYNPEDDQLEVRS